MIEVFAKSEPAVKLEDHVFDCLIIFRQIIGWKAPILKLLCDRAEISYEQLIHNNFLMVCFHDIGKASFSFQKKLRGERHKNESHPLASVPILYEILKDKPLKVINKIDFHPEILSVASHHTKLHQTLFDELGRSQYQPDYIKDYLQWYCQKVNQFAEVFSIPNYSQVVYSETMVENLPFDVFDKVFYSVSKLNTSADELVKRNLRDIFLITKAILHYCDWLASGGKMDFDYALNDGAEAVDRIMIQKTAVVDWKKPFQITAENARQNLFIQIPTGQGKTEASLLWATQFGKGRKIIYLLPTMVTSNKMWQRLCRFFNSQNVGITHSTASYILHRQSEEMEDQEIRKQLLCHKTFMHPVTVATIDQLLFSFFNWGHWVLTNANAYNSCIVVDEIHTYDPYTLGIILKMIEIVKDWNAHFAIMSATFPEYLKNQLQSILGSNITLVHDRSFDDMQRTRLNISPLENNLPIESAIDEIFRAYKNRKKVLVICNTVDSSRSIYQQVCEFGSEHKRMLYHSQFINGDKFIKEAQLEYIGDIEGGFIAVTTQIVEVSLDIDFDVMFTENAPIDALVQRLGRVNRKGKKEMAPIHIYAESEKSRKYVYNKKLLDLTRQLLINYSHEFQGNLKEKHYREIVNQIYNDINFDEDYYDELTEGKALITDLWWERTNLIYTLDANDKQLYAKTRREKYFAVEVILQQNLEAVNQLIEKKQYWKIQEWTLKVPYYRIKPFLLSEKIGKSDLLIAKCEYNCETGVNYKDDDSNFA